MLGVVAGVDVADGVYILKTAEVVGLHLVVIRIAETLQLLEESGVLRLVAQLLHHVGNGIRHLHHLVDVTVLTGDVGVVGIDGHTVDNGLRSAGC